ncbi:MAG: SBBP repeat-containing protein, partial [Candidatus Heimdallarchaeota archaeon]|nr:SBBP repeat-containing protein [Candidatus Heimdallarchaeota archaeon]MCK5049888.1 SBBP repeat-containing protein [Candidatus Heimdallarchaeota archaeon]
MILRNKHAIVLIYLSLSFLAFMSLGSIGTTFAETPEMLNIEPITDFSLVGEVTENLNLANISDFIQWSTFLGGSLYDYCRSVALDSNDNLIASGSTSSPDFP